MELEPTRRIVRDHKFRLHRARRARRALRALLAGKLEGVGA